MKNTITRLHGEKMLQRSAIRIGDSEQVFRSVLAGRGIRTALEIGTYRGCSAAAMAVHCERVVTIDLKHGQLEQRGITFDRAAFWQSIGLNNIAFHAVEDDAEKALLVEGLEFDFAFIDGAHDTESVCRDFALVKHCGLVLFHDYDPRPGHDAVYHFVRSLPGHVDAVRDFALWRAA